MLITPNLSALIDDIAKSLNKQFRYIPTAPVESQKAYEASIKDATEGIATALHTHVTGFNVDMFYKQTGYPGTHPIHQK